METNTETALSLSTDDLQEKGQDERVQRILAQGEFSRYDLIALLQEVQDVLGYLSPGAVRQIAEALGMSDNDVYGVATFYSQFRFQQRGKHCMKVCLGTACHVRGSSLIMETVGRELHVQPGETTADGVFSIEAVACMGSCALAPVAVMDDTVYGRVTQKKVDKLLQERRQEKGNGAVASTSGS